MGCDNCGKKDAHHIADGLNLCGECEDELSKHEKLQIQAENLGVTVSDITAAENRER